MTASLPESDRLRLATDAYVWGFSRMLFAKYLRDFRRAQGPLNRFLTMDRMLTPEQGGVNVDTLYGVAWLDTGNGPVVLDVPDSGGRYYSIQMVDMFAYNFRYVGRRTSGTGAGKFLVAGPGWQGDVPPGMTLIRTPSRLVFCFLRTLIDDEADVAKANAFHERLAVYPLAKPGERHSSLLMSDLFAFFPPAHSHLDRLGPRFFDCLGDALAEDGPSRAIDVQRLLAFEPLGIGPGRHPLEEDPGRETLFAQAVRDGHARIFATSATTAGTGWSITNRRIDEAAEDALIKASMNRLGICTLSVEEAIYLLPTPLSCKPGEPVASWKSSGPDGQPLSGANRYRLRFAPGQLPPVDAFWSLTMYGATHLLVDNPLKRYAIGDRTAGLQMRPDGGLDVLMQPEPPTEPHANWLPSPAGEFHLIFRAYQPKPAFITGAYALPPLEILQTR